MLKIFIAEDHVVIRQILSLYLSSQPQLHVVGQSSEGTQVVNRCLELKPDVLLLDIDLPGQNGISIARALTPVLPDLQILIFSSHYDAATIRRALEAGVRGFIEKTCSVETLMKAIEIVGAGKAYFGELVTQILQQSLSSPPASRTPKLTNREQEVLQWIAEGLSNKEVATKLGISVKTAENHRHNVMQKLDAHNAADLTREAYRLGLLRASPLPDFTGGKPSVSAPATDQP